MKTFTNNNSKMGQLDAKIPRNQTVLSRNERLSAYDEAGQAVTFGEQYCSLVNDQIVQQGDCANSHGRFQNRKDFTDRYGDCSNLGGATPRPMMVLSRRQAQTKFKRRSEKAFDSSFQAAFKIIAGKLEGAELFFEWFNYPGRYHVPMMWLPSEKFTESLSIQNTPKNPAESTIELFFMKGWQ
jgi:hypothetical protein